MPRDFRGRGWVRARLERVETPLKRTRKSRNARSFAKGRKDGLGEGLVIVIRNCRAMERILHVSIRHLKNGLRERNNGIGPGFANLGSTLKVQKVLPRLLEMQLRQPVAQSYLRNTGRITLGRGVESSAPFFPVQGKAEARGPR